MFTVKIVYTRKEIIHKVISEIREFMEVFEDEQGIDIFYLEQIIFADARCLLSVGVINNNQFLLLYNILCRMLSDVQNTIQTE